jgi:nucleoside-diphosphate-sugar epimerase
MEKVAVTGATGFIGKHLVVGLEKAGFEVIQITKEFEKVDCSRVYHLACPSTTKQITDNTIVVMDTILDATRKAMQICPTALFVNASTFGVHDIDDSAQGAYNIAKRCMEVYLTHSDIECVNFRLPSVYGEDMSNDTFIKRCIDGTAYEPKTPDKLHYISHIDAVVEGLINLSQFDTEVITLGNIYEQFTTGRRGLHRPAPSTQITEN